MGSGLSALFRYFFPTREEPEQHEYELELPPIAPGQPQEEVPEAR